MRSKLASDLKHALMLPFDLYSIAQKLAELYRSLTMFRKLPSFSFAVVLAI
jgi:hypothetical protein